MNNGESLLSAIQWSGPGKGACRKGASLDRLLLVLGLVVLATAVVLAATPGETPVSVESGGPVAPARLAAVGLSGNDPVNGAWSRAEAEWLACNGNGVPELVCSAETFGATP